MISGSVTGLGALDDLVARLHALQNLDLRPLADRIARIVEEDGRAGLLAGIDADGNPMAPLAPSTLKHRAGSGPPGAPTSASALVAGFVASVEITPTGLTIQAGYQDGAKARFFSEGTRYQPARNLQGIRPETQRKIEQALYDFAASVGTQR